MVNLNTRRQMKNMIEQQQQHSYVLEVHKPMPPAKIAIEEHEERTTSWMLERLVFFMLLSLFLVVKIIYTINFLKKKYSLREKDCG